MVVRTWMLIIAIGIAATLGQAQEQAQAPEEAAAPEQPPTQAFPIPLPVDIVEDQAAADARQRSEAEARQREIDDLAAQEGMNVAAQAMNDATQRAADYARISTWLVGIGTALLFVTLWLTRQANRAAQDAVAVTRDMGQRQLRAYIVAESAAVVHDAEKDRMGFRITIRNTGQTPAYNMSVLIGATIKPVANKRSFEKTDGGKSSRAVLGANAKILADLDVRDHSAEKILGLASAGSHEIIVVCLICYTDAFRRRRKTLCIWKLNAKGFLAGRMEAMDVQASRAT